MKNPFPTRQGPSLLLNGRSGSSLTDESDPGHFRTSDRTSGYDTEAQDSDMAPYCTRSGINGPAFRAGSSRPYTYNDDVPDESFSSVLTQIRPETTLPVERGCLFRWIPVRAPRGSVDDTAEDTVLRQRAADSFFGLVIATLPGLSSLLAEVDHSCLKSGKAIFRSPAFPTGLHDVACRVSGSL